MDDEDLDAVVSALGAAIGFTIVAAMRSPELFKTNAGTQAFRESISDLLDADTERFSPHAALAMMGVTDGISAYLAATPDSEGELF